MIDEFKTALLFKLEEFKSNMELNQSNKIKYETLKNLYNKIVSIKDEKKLREFIDYLIAESLKLEKQYNNKKENHKNFKGDLKDKNKLALEINNLAYTLDIYNRVINLHHKIFSKKRSSIVGIETSEEIINLIKQYNSLDSKTTEAKNLNKKIYDLRCKREEEIKSLYGMNGVKILFEIESLEDKCSLVDEAQEEYEVDCNEFIRKIKNHIYAINEFNFRNKQMSYFGNKTNYMYDKNKSDGQNESIFMKKYLRYIKNYKNMIISLFGSTDQTLYKNSDISISALDFLNLLTNYNILGGYNLFSATIKSGRVGNEKADKKMYSNNLELINNALNGLCELVKEKMLNNKIKVVNHEPTTKSILEDIKNKYLLLGKVSNLDNQKVK